MFRFSPIIAQKNTRSESERVSFVSCSCRAIYFATMFTMDW